MNKSDKQFFFDLVVLNYFLNSLEFNHVEVLKAFAKKEKLKWGSKDYAIES